MMDIEKLAREAGLAGTNPPAEFFLRRLERFAALVAEEAAKVCESLFDMDDDSCSEAEQCAAAIRERFKAS